MIISPGSSGLCAHGIDSLSVVDAPIMPPLITGNTNVQAMMIAESATEMILGAQRNGQGWEHNAAAQPALPP